MPQANSQFSGGTSERTPGFGSLLLNSSLHEVYDLEKGMQNE